MQICLLLALAALTAARNAIFECDDNVNYDEDKNFCTISNFVADHDDLVVFSPGLNRIHIKYMKCYDSNIGYIPYKLFETFPNLQSLDISNSYLLDLSRNSFRSADNLLYLNMSLNQIKSLGESSFAGASKIIKIELASNEIAEISGSAFKGLDNLDKLILSRNKIKSLEQHTFYDNVNLINLYLDNNQLESIPKEVFRYCENLRILDLSNNRIKALPVETFAHQFVLESLFLSGNKLESFALNNTYILNRLHLDNNTLKSLELHSIKNVRATHNQIVNVTIRSHKTFESLILANNNITNIQNITNLTNLVYLDLSSNKVGPTIGLKTFSKLQNLRELRLRNISLPKIMYGMFSKQEKLALLDLGFNGLKELNLDMLTPYMALLKQFFIDGNNLTEIKGKSSFTGTFPYLYTIGLSMNKFNCTYLHHIITQPFLSQNVKLHIEPAETEREKTHIRDVTCQHEDEDVLKEYDDEIELKTVADTEVQGRNAKSMPQLSQDERHAFEDTISGMKMQVRHLEYSLLWFECIVVAIGALFCVALIVKYLTYHRKYLPVRSVRDSSIVFRSSTTVNTTEDVECA